MRELSVLNRGLEYGFQVGSEHLYRCPYKNCNSRKRQDKFKMSINVEKNYYKCWSCGRRGRGLHKLLRSIGQRGLAEEMAEILGEFSEEAFELLFTDDVEEVREQLSLPEGYQFILSGNNYRFQSAKQYLYDRGLTDDDFYRLKIGLCTHGEFANRIIFPSFDGDGNVNYFVGRYPFPSRSPYKVPRARKSEVIFNEYLIDWKKPVAIVEGVFDGKGIENCIPILGSTLYDNHALFSKLLEHKPKVYLGLDSDAQSKEMELAKRLLGWGLDVFEIPTEGIEDLGAISKEEAEGLLGSSMRLTEEAIFMKQFESNLEALF
jgi:DNA primase